MVENSYISSAPRASAFGRGFGRAFGRGISGAPTNEDQPNSGRGRGFARGDSSIARGGFDAPDFNSTERSSASPGRAFGAGFGRAFGRGNSGVPASEDLPNSGRGFARGADSRGDFNNFSNDSQRNMRDEKPMDFNKQDYQPSQKNNDNAEPGRPPSLFVPKIRPVEELFKEDTEHAMNYLSIADEDEEVTVSGAQREICTLGDWKDANFQPKLYYNVVECAKYIRPRKIQSMAIPLIMEGLDIKGHAETGSGKTAAFLLPLINAIMKTEREATGPFDRPAPYAIVIEPTRELCVQVYEQGRKFANDTGVSVAKAYGQYMVRENMNELRIGCDILCATPGRLKHFIFRNMIRLDKLKYVVLDEADSLLENNFLEDIGELIKFPSFPDKDKRQTMFFSATFPELIQKLSQDLLKPDHVMVSNKKLVSTSSKVAQKILLVPSAEKKDLLVEILKKESDVADQTKGIKRVLVFVRTKRDADLIALYLLEKGLKSTSINSDRDQGLREEALRDFRNGEASILVSTDVCSRGIDIKDLDHVINYDLPSDAVTYVHRIGRTGRIKHGLATSFFDEFESNDCNLANDLSQFLLGANLEVPEFLQKVVSGSGAAHFGAEDVAQANNDDW